MIRRVIAEIGLIQTATAEDGIATRAINGSEGVVSLE